MTSSATVIFLDRATIPESISIPSLGFDHEWIEFDYTRPDQVIERAFAADVIITNKVVLDSVILAQLPNLRCIAVAATGVNNIDVDYCRHHGIALMNVQGYATQSVPEHVMAMIFALKRNLLGYHHDIAKGEWQRNKQFCFFTHSIGDVSGSTLGIIGSGTLGQATAQLATAIGMKVIFAERKGLSTCREGFLPFDTVLQTADVISLHCPLNEMTRDCVAGRELNLMKNHALLINTGRGGLVDEIALVEALQQGVIAGAGVDVFTQEPADRSHPLLANMDHLPNLILTPHVAWGSDSAIRQLVAILIANIDAFMRGEPSQRVV
jgi:glycerate dehydrogenase